MAQKCKSNQRDEAVLTWNKPHGASAHFSFDRSRQSVENKHVWKAMSKVIFKGEIHTEMEVCLRI